MGLLSRDIRNDKSRGMSLNNLIFVTVFSQRLANQDVLARRACMVSQRRLGDPEWNFGGQIRKIVQKKKKKGTLPYVNGLLWLL